MSHQVKVIALVSGFPRSLFAVHSPGWWLLALPLFVVHSHSPLSVFSSTILPLLLVPYYEAFYYLYLVT
ncbi:hypothetical protein BDR07DRAFT_1429254 [Suillus spraguei]|nr:hypothetical protein BDR07DRAFT_1429254 [Suillus spraguei]